MNDAQYARYKNALATRMSCLASRRDGAGNYHFLIESSQRYKVSLYRDDGRATCSCPDFSCRSRTEAMVCKHVVFVLMTHLGVIRSLDHAFFRRTSDRNDGRPWLTRDELDAVATAARRFVTPAPKSSGGSGGGGGSSSSSSGYSSRTRSL